MIRIYEELYSQSDTYPQTENNIFCVHLAHSNVSRLLFDITSIPQALHLEIAIYTQVVF